MVDVSICLARSNHGGISINGTIYRNVDGVFYVPLPIIGNAVLQYPLVAGVDNLGSSLLRETLSLGDEVQGQDKHPGQDDQR